jgi:hypothetical protein
MTQEQEIRARALDIALRLYLGSDDAAGPEKGTAEGLGLTPQEIITNYASAFEDFIAGQS